MATITTSEQYLFIDNLIRNGGPIAKNNNLPVAAMVACAIEESGYGTSSIYRETGCPFNLQKPSSYTWVNCRTITKRTCVETDDRGKCKKWVTAPFCKASGNDEGEKLADAARIWCEWILGWSEQSNRERLLLYRHNPVEFARNLPIVGFGEQSKRVENGEKFVNALRRHKLVERCNNMF